MRMVCRLCPWTPSGALRRAPGPYPFRASATRSFALGVSVFFSNTHWHLWLTNEVQTLSDWYSINASGSDSQILGRINMFKVVQCQHVLFITSQIFQSSSMSVIMVHWGIMFSDVIDLHLSLYRSIPLCHMICHMISWQPAIKGSVITHY